VPVNILLLSGASLVGQNIVQVLNGRRNGLCLLATNSLANAPALADFDSVFLAPQTQSDPAIFDAYLERLIDREMPALTIPCRDDDVVALARLATRRPDLASRLLCGSLESACATVDKWASWEFSQRWNLSFVPTIIPESEEVVERFAQIHGFPLLAKPRFGFASRGVSLILNRDQLASVIGNTSLLLQRYIGCPQAVSDYMEASRSAGIPLFNSFESTKYSFQAMIGNAGEVLGQFATEHQMSQGVSQRVAKNHNADGLALGIKCAEAFAAAGWRGPINVQCQRTPDGELLAYEFNGRFTGATAARMMLGYDEMAVALQHFAEVTLTSPGRSTASYVVKQPVSCAVLPEIQSILETHGVWLPRPLA
jgi:carbamoyl-phosphate synthase large subunit